MYEMMNANELVSRMSETQTITFSFGKNGWGLSDEFISIGNRIKELSKYNNVYLIDAKIDAMDDVYDLTFEVHPHEENSAVMDLPADCLKDRINDLMEENKQLRNEIKALNSPKTANLVCQKL